MAYVRKYYGYAEASGQEDKSNNELMQEVQQQILLYKESTNKKLQKIEELIELAAKKMNMLRQMQANKRGKSYVNHFDWKVNVNHDRIMQLEVTSDALHHPEWRLPKVQGLEVSEWLQDDEHQLADFGSGKKTEEWSTSVEEENSCASWEVYTGEPIYDEELEEDLDYWPEKQFISAVLQGGHPDFPNPLPPEICTNVASEDNVNLSYTQVIQDVNQLLIKTPSQLEERINNGLCPYCPTLDGFQHVCKQACQSKRIKEEPATWLVNKSDRIAEYGDKTKFVEYKGEDTEGVVKQEASVVPTNMREVIWNVLFRDGPTAANSYGWEHKSSHLNRKKLFIFDPGGKVQNEQLKSANHDSKNINQSEVRQEAVMKNSAVSQLRHWQDMDFLAIEQQLLKESFQLPRKVFIIEIEVPTRLQGQGQNIQKGGDGFDKIVDEINQQFVDFGRTGMIALPYQYQYMVLEQGIPQIYKSMGPACHETSTKSVATYIFDPGGNSIFLHSVLLLVPKSYPLKERRTL